MLRLRYVGSASHALENSMQKVLASSALPWQVQIGRTGLGGRLGSSPFAALIAQLPRYSLVLPSETLNKIHRQHNFWTVFTWIHCTLRS